MKNKIGFTYISLIVIASLLTSAYVTKQSAPKAQEQETKAKWLIMLYQNADDEVLEKDIFTDLNEAEIIGSTDEVIIVSQMDRYKGGFDGDGDWTTVKRFVVGQDNDLEAIKSEEIEDLGELDSGDPKTLVDFATWAITNIPAEKYAIILSDHGAGWLGGWNDNDPVPESSFTVKNIDDAFAEIVKTTGIAQLEFIGFDACLMSQVEAISSIAPYTKYAAASQEVEPSLGWAYASFLEQLVKNPSMDGEKLSKAVINGYIAQDARINIDEARAIFVLENYGIEEPVSASEVVKEMSEDITLTAIKLAEFPAMVSSLNNFIMALTTVDKKAVSKARSYAQSFENVFGESEKPSYIDLGHFASLISENTDSKEVKQSVTELLKAIKKTVILEKHGAKRPGATGFTIYFPNKNLYELTTKEGYVPNYGEYAERFSKASLWYQFLQFHYNNTKIDPANVDVNVLLPASEEVPAEETPEAQTTPIAEPTETAEAKPTETTEAEPVEEPTSEEITIAPLTLSTQEITAKDKITINTEISDAINIAYIYLYTLYYDESDSTFLSANIDYVTSDKTKKLNGIFYPDWEVKDNEPLLLEVDWDPTIFFVTDGNEANDQFALFEPQQYGVALKDDVYTVLGTYSSKNSKDLRGAILEFNGEGMMNRLLVFYNKDRNGPPRIITPKEGDTFNITEQWFVEDSLVEYDGGTITFGKKRLEWMPYEAIPGKYIVGIVVEDVDGNSYEQWSDEVTISETVQ